VIRAGDLQRAKIVDENGRRIGHVDELQLKDGRLTALAFGVGGAVQRFWPWRHGGRIDWDKVVKLAPGHLTVSVDATQLKKSSKPGR
jgi:sporulation protein YlmC with PRC-barrel domain